MTATVHFIHSWRSFHEWPSGAAGFGSRRPPDQSLDGSEKAIISKPPAKPLGGVRAAEQVLLWIAGKPIGEIGKRSSMGASGAWGYL
jgi:hypothetical protein